MFTQWVKSRSKLLLFGSVLFLIFGPVQANAYELWDGAWTTEGPEPGSVQVTYSFINYTPDISVSAQRSSFEGAFLMWTKVAPLWFEEVNDTGLSFNHPNATGDNAGDIRILFASGAHGDGASWDFDGTNGQLAHAFYPPPNFSGNGTGDGDAHFDEDETWTNLSRNDYSQPIDLLTLAAHEFGHSLGLMHSTSTSALMYQYYTKSHRFLAADDIAGIQAKYGAGEGGVIPIPEPYTFLLLASGLAAMGRYGKRRLTSGGGRKVKN